MNETVDVATNVLNETLPISTVELRQKTDSILLGASELLNATGDISKNGLNETVSIVSTSVNLHHANDTISLEAADPLNQTVDVPSNTLNDTVPILSENVHHKEKSDTLQTTELLNETVIIQNYDLNKTIPFVSDNLHHENESIPPESSDSLNQTVDVPTNSLNETIPILPVNRNNVNEPITYQPNETFNEIATEIQQNNTVIVENTTIRNLSDSIQKTDANRINSTITIVGDSSACLNETINIGVNILSSDPLSATVIVSEDSLNETIVVKTNCETCSNEDRPCIVLNKNIEITGDNSNEMPSVVPTLSRSMEKQTQMICTKNQIKTILDETIESSDTNADCQSFPTRRLSVRGDLFPTSAPSSPYLPKLVQEPDATFSEMLPVSNRSCDLTFKKPKLPSAQTNSTVASNLMAFAAMQAEQQDLSDEEFQSNGSKFFL